MSERRQIDIDRDRVTVLLLINSLLIKKAYNIYVTILSNQQTIQRMLHQSRQTILDQSNNLNRRLQCNLSVLSYINDLYHNKAAAQQPNRLQFPVILTAPVEMPELKPLYKRLHDLYPEAIEFLKVKIQQMKQQQMQQPEDFQRRQLQQAQQQIKPMHMQQPQQIPIQLQQQERPQQSQQQQHQKQQSFSHFNMAPGQSHQQYSTPQMSVLQQRSLQSNTVTQVNPQLSQQQQQKQTQLKGMSPEPMSIDPQNGEGFSIDDSGFTNYQSLNAAGKSAPSILISPQQLLQQQTGNNDYSLGFF